MSQLTAAIIGFTSSIKSSRCASIIHQFSMGVSAFSPYESPSIQSRKSLKCGESPRGKSFAPKSAGRSLANHAGSGVPSEAPGSSSPSWWAFSFRNRRICCEHFCIFERMKNGWNPTQKSWKQASNIYMKQLLAPLKKPMDWYCIVTHSPWDLVMCSLRRLQDLRRSFLPIGWITAMEIVSYGKFFHITSDFSKFSISVSMSIRGVCFFCCWCRSEMSGMWTQQAIIPCSESHRAPRFF